MHIILCENVRATNENGIRKMHHEIPGNMLTTKSFGAQSFYELLKAKVSGLLNEFIPTVISPTSL